MSWSDAWSPELDRALDALPEMTACPHELYRILATTPSRARKRFARVRQDGAVVAVIALRRRFHHWELLCDGVVPFAASPSAPGMFWPALSALGQYVRIVEWGGEAPPARGVRVLAHARCYAISTRIDLDAYWASKHNTDWLRKARRRTERLGRVVLEVDAEGAAAWTIEEWHEKWKQHPAGETSATEDILAAARYLTARGRHHAFRLLVDGIPVAGVNAVANGSTLVMTQSYRDPAYDRAGVGVHLDEQIFRWAARSPYEAVDLGCGEGYKPRWAEGTGMRATYAIAPPHLRLAREAAAALRRYFGRDGRGLYDITWLHAPSRNKDLTTPLRTNEGQDAGPHRRADRHGTSGAREATESSRGVHT